MRVDPDFRFVVVTMSTNGDRMSFPVERVIGVDPLRQYLVKRRETTAGNGNSERSGEGRLVRCVWRGKPGDGEWGHWTGRGMTWNFMCASCHNTRLRKNYDPATDSYNTTMAEMGVGCEACHGPMANHVEWQYKHGKQKKVDPTIEKFTRDQHRDTCGTCHARRSELTGDFRPGDLFFDHYGLTIPDETDIFYPDGQVRDEDYEFMPFLASRMHAGGVRCFDCHEPHSMKTRGKGNVLCMTCHGPGTPMTNSPIIDPLAHGHHPLDKGGSGCIDCHMPLTPYMQRHLRHDHGFTIPDPLLTKQYGIPNACNRCHKDKDVAWSLEWVEKWYGARMERPSRVRAQTVAEARNGKQSAVPGLIKMMKEEERYPLWRAVAAGMLKRWSYEPEVTKALLERTKDTDPLVRTLAARALELVLPGNPPVQEALRQLTSDPVRSVRTEAAWGLRATIDTNSNAGKDLVRYIAQHRDQPSGALQQGVFLLDRGQIEEAMVHLRQAVSWDTNSAPLHHALAVALSMQGKAEEAIGALQTACQLAPREAEYHFKLGLAYNEVNRQKDARQALEQAVRLDAEYAQGWYNLGLARASANELQAGVEALTRAEQAGAAVSAHPVCASDDPGEDGND